jgi:zinc protease
MKIRQLARLALLTTKNLSAPGLVGSSLMLLTTGAIMASSRSSSADPAPLTPVRQLSLPNGMPLTEYQLPNGLTLYVIENHAAPVFTYQTWFKVGSKDEFLDAQIGATGLAHLFEHMMFRGTAKVPDGQFDDQLSENGATDENATTWVDRTNFYESVPSSQLSLVMQLESDRMANLAIIQSLLTTEQSVVLGEYNMGQDDPDTVAYDLLYSTAFTVHPYKYSVIGTPQNIQAFTLAQANYFYKTYYSPSNATVLVVGDVVPATVAQTAQQSYGAITSTPVNHLTAPVEPVQTQALQATFSHPQLQQTRVIFGYHTPGVASEDFPALQVVQSALTLGQGSLLQIALVNGGLSVSVKGDVNQFEDPGLFTIETDLEPGQQVANVQDALDQVLGTLAADTSGTDLTRAVNQLLLSMNGNLEDNGSMASFLGEFIITASDPVFAFTRLAAIQAVTAADVSKVIHQYLIPTNRTVIVGTPGSGT